jgi:DUF1680 family protein
MTPFNSFWCCTGTGMENHAKYGDSIYFHTGDTLYVNLFIASELDWQDKGLRLRQDTAFPEEPGTTLVFEVEGGGPVDLALNLRIPAWITEGGSVLINGRRFDAFASPGSFLTIRRAWSDGDRVELALPMSLRLERLPDDPTVAAILYGPVVLAADLGPLSEEHLKYARSELSVRGHHGPVGDPVPVPEFKIPAEKAGAVSDPNDPSAWIEPVPGRPLTFRTDSVGDPEDVTLIPFYKLFDRYYSIYFTVLYPGQERPRPFRRR